MKKFILLLGLMIFSHHSASANPMQALKNAGAKAFDFTKNWGPTAVIYYPAAKVGLIYGALPAAQLGVGAGKGVLGLGSSLVLAAGSLTTSLVCLAWTVRPVAWFAWQHRDKVNKKAVLITAGTVSVVTVISFLVMGVRYMIFSDVPSDFTKPEKDEPKKEGTKTKKSSDRLDLEGLE